MKSGIALGHKLFRTRILDQGHDCDQQRGAITGRPMARRKEQVRQCVRGRRPMDVSASTSLAGKEVTGKQDNAIAYRRPLRQFLQAGG